MRYHCSVSGPHAGEALQNPSWEHTSVHVVSKETLFYSLVHYVIAMETTVF